MVVDKAGYRLNVGIIIANQAGQVFWGRRVGQHAWQFPQGGVLANETALEAMLREMKEEVGLDASDVEVMGVTKHWLKYRLPKQYLRQGKKPLVIGQKQKWFLLRLVSPEQKIRLDLSDTPEFDSWRWVDLSLPADYVIYFKRQVYRQALKELSSLLIKTPNPNTRTPAKRYRKGSRWMKS